ncbi:hypothetical protein VF21_10457, partial [Pseudogymnoascus sp. 05NY08]
MPLPYFFRTSSPSAPSIDTSGETDTIADTIASSSTHLTIPSSRASISSSSSNFDHSSCPSPYRIDTLISQPILERHYAPITTLSINIESPPLVFYGGASTSTGALLSGQLKLDVGDDEMEIQGFAMRLAVDVNMKKPFNATCPDCATKSSDLTQWKFLPETTILRQGEHLFPFSFLLPGQYQVCTHSSLSSVTYTLRALLTPTNTAPLHLSHPLSVRRAIRPPLYPRHYIRDFPPTSISAHLALPPLIHPTGSFNGALKLSGMNNTVLKRVNWRLDETQTVFAPSCRRHMPRPGYLKGVVRSSFSTLGSAELTSGWATPTSSTTTLDFTFGIAPTTTALCDVKTEDGTETAHALVVELLVESKAGTRLLRMRFYPVVTEREEGGVAWDEEAPPVYGDAGKPPPGYMYVAGRGEVPRYEEVVGGRGRGAGAGVMEVVWGFMEAS